MEPVIKVRHKLLLVFALFLAFNPVHAGISVCDKAPKDQTAEKTEGTNGFSVSLNGSPRLYRPHQTYTITLRGWRNEQLVKFQDFLLVVEPAPGVEILDPNSLGTFQLMPGDAMAKFSHLCSHTIGATSSISKKKIEAHWIAPGRHSGCVTFKAMVVERPGVWYMDDGELTYTVCEDSSALAEPQEVDPCCACDEAKYEIVFEGIWSRHTHPKLFPEDEWRTQFSTLIGASHSSNYSIWDYGEIASPALQVLGEKGITRPLETQMKHFSHSIRSVIKAHGLQQRSNVEGQTFAVFRVDHTHHLLSVVSKMIPSPDFIVGVSKENLCLSNCSWIPYRVLDLYPWDIGTDAAVGYNDSPIPQRPKDIIKRITSNYPDDPNSPFFDESGAPIKPAARLHIVRQKTYKRSNCPMEQNYASIPNPMNPSWIPNDNALNAPNNQGGYYQEDSRVDANNNPMIDNSIISNYEYPGSNHPDENSNSYNEDYLSSFNEPDRNNGMILNEDYSSENPCQTTEWGEWSECSETCNFGSRIRRRQFVDRSAAGVHNCADETFEKEVCNDLPKCDTARYGGKFDLFESGNQRKKKWKTGNEVEDVIQLYKTYPTNEREYPRNRHVFDTYLNDKQSYEYPSHDSQSDDDNIDCSVSEYGPWSDCSVSCGQGTKTRNRRYIEPEKSYSCSQELHEVRECVSPPCYGHYDLEEDMTPLNMPFRMESNNHHNYGPECQLSEWSSWSPCSKKCGLGYKIRTRLYLIPFYPERSCDVQLIEKANCYGKSLECASSYSDTFEEMPPVLNLNDDSLYRSESDICKLPPDPGPCRGHYTRWYFNTHDNKCMKFVFFGCEGNKNNFASEENCLSTCYTRSTKDWNSFDGSASLVRPFEMPSDEPAK